MPADMKEVIAGAAIRLLMERKAGRLTVKDIVEACQITRQTFYYHFADIPALIRWILEQNTDRLLRESQALEDGEQRLRHFFLVFLSAGPFIRKGMQSNYRGDLERLLEQYIYQFFERIVEAEDLYRSRTRAEVKLILRYHSQAIMGLLRGWSREDTERLDEIVRLGYLLIEGEIAPREDRAGQRGRPGETALSPGRDRSGGV